MSHKRPEPQQGVVVFEEAAAYVPPAMAQRKLATAFCPECGIDPSTVDGHREHLRTPFWEVVQVKTRWNPPIPGVGFVALHNALLERTR
jgi:hypothetical protein